MTDARRTGADGERKQVTVLFADVQGSMDLAEGQDPEQWRGIMQGFFTILADEVRRFEGTVDKFTGDGIMAVFGAPIAHEDHARRACYAALRMLDDISEYAAELRRRHGLSFSARIGINSGEVVAGAIGAAEDADYTAIGHTVGLAQRMEALAEPGKAYLTGAAAELARGFFELADLGEFEIKGASRPVRVFELAGVGSARSRLDLSRERGFSRFVGREEEMSVLLEALERAKAGEGAAVGIVAEPGVGKSRLCHEFAERCRAEGIEVFECQAQAHGRDIPFMPVLQMLRSYFEIADGDPERRVREKIAGRALLLDPSFADDLPILFDFLGVPDTDHPLPQLSAEARNRSLRGVVCKLVRAPRRRSSIVTIVEDLHWIDEASEVLLGELLGSVEGTQTLGIVNFRPEYEAPWNGPRDYRQIELQPLGPDDTRELLRDLAGEDPSIDGLAELIHERTAGNPFFIEEIVRTLAEDGTLEGERGAYRLLRPVEDTGVPASVQTVLAARIDRLRPEAKRLLQAASVAGKEVGERTLARIAGEEPERLEPVLRELIEAGFLYEAELYPERVLAFRHPLTREVAYGTQLAEQRAPLHAATARALLEANPERHDEQAALVAHHYEEAGDVREAARWSARAAYWTGHNQPREAKRLWRRVMELADRLPEGDEERAVLAVSSRLQQLDYAWRLGMDQDEEARLIAEVEEIAGRGGDLRALALLRIATGVRPGKPHQAETWVAAAAETNRLAAESGDPHLRAAIRGATAYVHLCTGEFDAYEAALDEVLEMAGNDRSVGAGIVIGCPVAWAYMGKGVVRRERGQPEEAERLLSTALRVATEEGDPETASWTRSNLATLLAIQGDVEAGLAMAKRNCELTERLGDVFSRTLALANLGWVQMAGGDFAAALESLESAERIYREAMGSGGEMGSWRAALRAEALTGIGRVEEAIELADEAARTAEERGMGWALPTALLALGRALAAAGRGDEAREALERGAAAARRTGGLMLLRRLEEEMDALAAAAR